MIGSESFLEDLRQIVSQESSIPALRTVLFLLGLFAALGWRQGRPRLCVLLLAVGGLAGLSYWLIQLTSPLGFETDEASTRDWAQAGVNAAADSGGGGFVTGTEPENSLVSWLAAAGVPLSLVHRVPQIAALAALGLMVALPLALVANPTTSAFAAALAISGGVWPGVSPYSAILLRPSLLGVLAAGITLALAFARHRRARRWFSKRPVIPLVFLGLSALDRSGMALLLVSLLLAAPLRAVVRLLSPSPGSARRLEAGLLLCAFGGSGLLWWNPSRTVPGFVGSSNPGAALRRPLDWIALHVSPGDVILASPAYSAPIAALSGRRVLFPPPGEGRFHEALREPFRRARLRDSVLQGAPIARLAGDFSLTHVFLGPGEPSPPRPAQEGASDEPLMRLVPVYEDIEGFRVFRLAKK